MGLGKENMVFSVVGDQAKQVELAAGKLQDLSENFSVEELSLTNDHAQICQKYITNLKMTERKSRPFNVSVPACPILVRLCCLKMLLSLLVSFEELRYLLSV